MAKSNTSNDSRTELMKLVKEKMQVAETLVELQRKIYAYETSYLEDTHLTGNVVRGWSNFLAPDNKRNRKTVNGYHNGTFNEADRIFSNSSVTSMAAIEEVIGDVVREENLKTKKSSELETPHRDSDINTATEYEDWDLKNGQNTLGNISASAKRTAKKKK